MKLTAFLFSLFFSHILISQELQKGEVIEDYGSFYKVENPGFKTDTTTTLKVVFDVARSFEDPAKPNRLFEVAARFLNLHVDAGFPPENLEVALVIHGGAINDVTKDKAYIERHPDTDLEANPNTDLLNKLAENGVKIILCGQSAKHNNISRTNAHKEAEIALSAMTALVQLQNNEYRLINF
ncbi:DsrE family protein [Salegentibacter chungangensis]|uniref:DsrE family protein n=1 Tax=Salegentibacter chungangensis TaxID=1335724 RepID=A0ABW3NSI8_9FLAO